VDRLFRHQTLRLVCGGARTGAPAGAVVAPGACRRQGPDGGGRLPVSPDYSRTLAARMCRSRPGRVLAGVSADAVDEHAVGRGCDADTDTRDETAREQGGDGAHAEGGSLSD